MNFALLILTKAFIRANFIIDCASLLCNGSTNKVNDFTHYNKYKKLSISV